MNKLLPLPVTQTDMVCRVTVRGLEVTKAGKYKKRHYGSSDVYECPNSKFYTKQQYKAKFPKEFIKQKPTKATQKKSGQLPKTPKPHAYKIDKRTVTKRLSTFWQTLSGEKQLYFWTITFPQGTTETEGHKLFNIWLTRMRDEMNLRSYLWVKELQANGTIHFHIAVHQKLAVKQANRFMRASIMRAIDNQQISWERHKAVKYNGVDIAKDRKTKRVVNFAKSKKAKALSNYLTKYVTKNQTEFTMLAWHCSRDYSNIITSFALTREEVKKFRLHKEINENKFYENDYFKIFYWSTKPPDRVIKYFELINTHIREILMS